MAAVNHVLIATDGSATALKAAAFAGDLARAFGARISVLFVQSDELIVSNAWGAGSAMSVDQVRENLEQQARDNELPATVNAAGPLDHGAEPFLEWGHPATEICRF
ncbi:MAG: universal stress protein, partial [Gammaproteobacteria bacterium]